MKFCPGIHGPQRMDRNDFGEPSDVSTSATSKLTFFQSEIMIIINAVLCSKSLVCYMVHYIYYTPFYFNVQILNV